MNETLPDHMGPYSIERRLGSGGMGTVYLGRHQDSGRLAAVKVLNAAYAQQDGAIERFLREAEALRQLGGPHIVEVYDSGTDTATNQLYFAMEYVDGETLADRIRAEKRLPWEQAVDIALQICAALKVAHAAGVVHRDIKPSNLLLGRDGTVKLTDFGVAQVFATSRLTVTGGIIGTAEYMSPEQASGQRATKKSDLYSLGALLYVMLTGRPPFTGTSPVDIIRKHATHRFDLPSLYEPTIPRVLEEVVCKLLEKDPDNRIPDANVVMLRLKEVVRRVELASRNDETVVREGPSLEAPTAVAGQSSNEVGETRVLNHGPGPATIVRNQFRKDFEEQNRRTPLGKFFDHPVVLIVLLIAIVGGVTWKLSNPNKLDSGDDTAALNEGGKDEVERFWKLARGYRRLGDVVREERILSALKQLIVADEHQKQTLDRIDARLSELKQSRIKAQDDWPLFRNNLERATQLKNDGKLNEALAVLDSLLELYGTDPQTNDLVSQARQLRQEWAMPGEVPSTQ